MISWTCSENSQRTGICRCHPCNTLFFFKPNTTPTEGCLNFNTNLTRLELMFQRSMKIPYSETWKNWTSNLLNNNDYREFTDVHNVTGYDDLLAQ